MSEKEASEELLGVCLDCEMVHPESILTVWQGKCIKCGKFKMVMPLIKTSNGNEPS